tara:strand:+ start:213 stop:905 length:693 start_codon:yes stop_codon:yes gene_type:complete
MEKSIFKTAEILQVAFAVHRHNGGYYRETRRFSEETPTLFSNKEAIGCQLGIYTHNPNDFQPITITQEDKDHASKCVDYLRKAFAFQIIADSLNDFMKNLIDTISVEENTLGQFGVISVAPKIYFETINAKETKKEIKEINSESKHIGLVGQPVEGMFYIRDIKFVEKFTCHVVNGHMDGNLVSFFKSFDQTKELPKVGTEVKIRGKVKRHGENYQTKLPETTINYVKIG